MDKQNDTISNMQEWIRANREVFDRLDQALEELRELQMAPMGVAEVDGSRGPLDYTGIIHLEEMVEEANKAWPAVTREAIMEAIRHGCGPHDSTTPYLRVVAILEDAGVEVLDNAE